MSDQPEALRLAEYMDAPLNDPEDVADAAAAELRRLHAEVEAMRADYGNACKLVVDIHAAATGRPGEGPRLGVVEDVAAVRAECDALRAQVADFHAMWEVNSKGFAEVEAERDALVQATGASSVLEAIGIIRGNKAQLARLTTPNLYWIDGGESQVAEELCELADNIAADISGDDRECTVTVGCARELPSMQMRVWIDEEGSMDYDTAPLPDAARAALKEAK